MLKPLSNSDLNISKLEKEKTILMKLQFHSGGSQFHVKCLDHQLEWKANETGQQQGQNLYIISSETGWLKNDLDPGPTLYGLVLESGGVNLEIFLRDPLHNPSRFGIIPRVNILRDIVSALQFLERCRIVHGDLKPENIVLFQSSNGSGNTMSTWKLIDFDNSYDLTSQPSPKIDPRNPETFLTPEYIPPELAVLMNPGSNSPLQPLDPSHKMDIWSLGLISVFVLKGQSLWNLYPGFNSIAVFSSIIDFNEEHFKRWLNVEMGDKEGSFVEDCFRIDPRTRSSPSLLLKKSLFSTGQSTVLLNSLETSTVVRNQLVELIGLVDRGVRLDDLDDRLRSAVSVIMNQLENPSLSRLSSGTT